MKLYSITYWIGKMNYISSARAEDKYEALEKAVEKDGHKVEEVSHWTYFCEGEHYERKPVKLDRMYGINLNTISDVIVGDGSMPDKLEYDVLYYRSPIDGTPLPMYGTRD